MYRNQFLFPLMLLLCLVSIINFVVSIRYSQLFLLNFRGCFYKILCMIILQWGRLFLWLLWLFHGSLGLYQTCCDPWSKTYNHKSNLILVQCYEMAGTFLSYLTKANKPPPHVFWQDRIWTGLIFDGKLAQRTINRILTEWILEPHWRLKEHQRWWG